MLTITLSNKLEALSEILLSRLAEPPPSLFIAEQIIVPSTAMKRRLEWSIADRFGICSNVQFSFLANWLWRQIGKIASVAEESPFAPSVLAWRVYRIFGDAAFVHEHPRLLTYLEKADAVMRYDLALQTAALLDQYITFRPDWLAAWSEGKPAMLGAAATAAGAADDQQWQAALWRRITEELGTARQHPSVTFFQAVETLGAEAIKRLQLPQATHVFCATAMAPLYIDILRKLGRLTDLNLYVLNPCREYWFEIVDPRRLSYLAASGDTGYHESGNRLLAAWGQQTQAQLGLLFDDARLGSAEESCFIVNAKGKGGSSLLARVQDAILDMQDLAPGSISLAGHDRSIEVQVCHSLSRELEVLQDRLLALLAEDAPPASGEILVVTPDLEQAAPLIDAIFGNAALDRRIPYSITGRARSRQNPVARALLDLLALGASRVAASSLFDLLQQPVVAARFGLGGDQLDAIHDWIEASGIRWGLDGSHRAQFGLPASDRYSVRDGVQRLFLGYALPAGHDVPFNGRLPAGDPVGTNALALGSFRQFARQLDDLHTQIKQDKTPTAWMHTLSGVLESFMAPVDDQLDDLREVQDRIRELHGDMQRGGADNQTPLEVMRNALQAAFDDPARGGVPSGVLTFSSMSSLRNLPYRVLCAIGLNDGAFPTSRRPAEFDLMSLSPRRGDRQRRSDERNLFLDLLLAARERLYLSYTGRNVRDNSVLPPSVLISDLLDYLAAATAGEPDVTASVAAARARLVVQHPLQPFSIDYFKQNGDSRVRSSNAEYCDALKKGLTAPIEIIDRPVDDFASDHAAGEDSGDEAAPMAEQKFFSFPLAEPGEEWRDVSLDQLMSFFRNPCRYLLRSRLGIAFADEAVELQDDEPFLSDWTSRSALAERLLPLFLAQRKPEDIRAIALAGTEYPSGKLGSVLLDRELQMLGSFAQELMPEIGVGCLPPSAHALDFDLDGQAWRLSGGFSDVRPGGLLRYRYDDARAADYLAGWIAHLFLNATAPPEVAPITKWHSRDGSYTMSPCKAARAQLQDLLRLYRQGLSAPLHFFPKSSWQYVISQGSLEAAGGKWRSTRQRPHGEELDPAFCLALRGHPDPLDADFIACSEAVLGQLMNHLEDPRL
jgi:exodeoxyribonuclease V gamma subunit